MLFTGVETVTVSAIGAEIKSMTSSHQVQNVPVRAAADSQSFCLSAEVPCVQSNVY